MQKAQHKNMEWLVVAGLLVLLPGCGFVQPELPPELVYVVDNEETFLSDPEQVPVEVTPGALVDDLDGLSGCWGAMRLPDEEMPVKFHAAYHFDAETMHFDWWSLQRDPVGLNLFSVLILDTGTYEVIEGPDNEQTVLVVTERWVNDPFTGELEKKPLEPQEGIAVFTLDGDYLYEWIGDVPEDGVLPDGEWWYVYRRFECPAAED